MITSISRGANPDFNSDELLYQLQETKASVIITGPESLDIALSAAQSYGLSAESIILFNGKSPSIRVLNHHTIQDVVDQGFRATDSTFVERKLLPGEARTKLAFLSFSSGTTGKPKVRESFNRVAEYYIECFVILGYRYFTLCPNSECYSDRGA